VRKNPRLDGGLPLGQAVIAAVRFLKADKFASRTGRPITSDPCIEERGSA
jgi:hypothetical protein